MERRDFLKKTALGAAGVSAALASSQSVFAAPQAEAETTKRRLDSDPVLVVIYNRGGQDQLNTFVPYTDSDYYTIRPTVAVPKDVVLKVDGPWGLHPALEPLKPFYDKGQFTAVINSGSPHPTGSHFDAQDFMEYASLGDRSVRDGWLNRYLSASQADVGYRSDSLRALAMQELLPRSLRGQYPVLAVPPHLEEIEEVLDLFEDFYSGDEAQRRAEELDRAARLQGKEGTGIRVDPVMATGRETIQGLRRLRKLIYGGNSDGPVAEYPGGQFAGRLEMLARVIKADVGLQIAATDINGWDHHIGMGNTDGTINRMLTSLAEGIAAFMTDLGPHLDRTVILMCTEFGRTCKENGNDGADHGHGGAMWLLGGGLNGGKIYGTWNGLKPDAMYRERSSPVHTDFRAIFAEVLYKHMGFTIPEGFFPKYTLPMEGIGLFA